MHISEQYLNELNISHKQNIKDIGIGAGIGAGYGIYKGAIRKTDASDRIDHWKGKLSAANTRKEKEEAEKKLKYWKKVNRRARFAHIKSSTKRYGMMGAGTGASTVGLSKLRNTETFRNLSSVK